MKNDIKLINESPLKIYGAFAGAGQHFAYNFLNEPGASKTILGLNFPYSQCEFDKFCGIEDEEVKYASLDASVRLAKKSYTHARFSENGANDIPIGIGVAASLATENERADRKHRFYITILSGISDGCSLSAEDIDQGLLPRKYEDAMVFIYITKLLTSYLNQNPNTIDASEEIKMFEQIAKVSYTLYK